MFNQRQPEHDTSTSTTEALSPGELLRQTLADIGMSQAELARRTGWSVKHVGALVHDRVSITRNSAVRLSEVTGVDSLVWLRADLDYRGAA